MQLGEAYEQRLLEQAVLKADGRRAHRQALEEGYDEAQREAGLTQGSLLTQECLSFAGALSSSASVFKFKCNIIWIYFDPENIFLDNEIK